MWLKRCSSLGSRSSTGRYDSIVVGSQSSNPVPVMSVVSGQHMSSPRTWLTAQPGGVTATSVAPLVQPQAMNPMQNGSAPNISQESHPPPPMAKAKIESEWIEKFSTTYNRKFWKNTITGKSTWYDPFPTQAQAAVTVDTRGDYDEEETRHASTVVGSSLSIAEGDDEEETISFPVAMSRAKKEKKRGDEVSTLL